MVCGLNGDWQLRLSMATARCIEVNGTMTIETITVDQPRKTYQFVRSNYRRTGGHYDYGNIVGILPAKTLTYSSVNAVYYTVVQHLWSDVLTPTHGQISGIPWLINYRCNRLSSIWGSAENQGSHAFVATPYLSWTNSSPSLVLAIHVQGVGSKSTMDAGGTTQPFGSVVTIFVVSR